MRLDAKMKRDLYIQILPDSYEFISREMGWSHRNCIYVALHPNKPLSIKQFNRIERAFRKWQQVNGQEDYLSNREELKESLASLEERAIEGGKYDLYVLLSKTHEFLETI